MNPPTPLYTYRDLAEYLAVSEVHLRRLVMYRRIPFLKIGRAVRFRPTEIEDWLAQQSRR